MGYGIVFGRTQLYALFLLLQWDEFVFFFFFSNGVFLFLSCREMNGSPEPVPFVGVPFILFFFCHSLFSFTCSLSRFDWTFFPFIMPEGVFSFLSRCPITVPIRKLLLGNPPLSPSFSWWVRPVLMDSCHRARCGLFPPGRPKRCY